MQDIITFDFHAGITPTMLLLGGLLLLVCLCFFMILRLGAEQRRQHRQHLQHAKDIMETLIENGAEGGGSPANLEGFMEQQSQATADNRQLLDRLASDERDFHSDIHAMHEEMTALANSLREAHGLVQEETATLRGMMEKNSVFIYDRFNELARELEVATSEHGGGAGIGAEVKAQMAAQHQRLEDLHQLLSQQQAGDAQTKKLREDLAAEIAALMEKERAHQQEAQTKTLSALEALHESLSQQKSGNAQVQKLRDDIAREIADLMLKERARQQEAQTQTISLIGDSINRLSAEMDEKLMAVTDKVSGRFNENLANTMQSFHTLQGQIDSLLATRDEMDALGSNVSSLARLLLSKSGGIADGNLAEMLATMLPEDAYLLNPVLHGHAVAAQILVPGEEGPVVVEDTLPLEDFNRILAPEADDAMRQQARQQFGGRVMAHIDYVAQTFISPPTTGTHAMLLVKSEVAFAEIQAHHKDCVSHAANRKVWIVSPTTLAAVLNMARNALKDQKAHEQLELMRKSLRQVARDAQSFEARLLEIGDHVSNAVRSVQRAESAGIKLFGEVRSITAGAGNPDAEDQDPPALTQSQQSQGQEDPHSRAA